jgi:hypothetical protein
MQGCPVLPRQGVRLRAALTEEDQRRGARRGGGHHHWEQVSHFFFYSICKLQRKFEANIPRKRNCARPNSQFTNSYVSDLYIPTTTESKSVTVSSPVYTAPKIRNKYSQERNCARPQSQFPHSTCVSVSDLYIPTIDLLLSLEEIMLTDPGNI